MHRQIDKAKAWEAIKANTTKTLGKETTQKLIPKVPPFVKDYVLNFFEFFLADSPSGSLTAVTTATEILIRYLTRCRVCGGYGHNKAGYVPCKSDQKGGQPMQCGTLTRLQSKTSHNKLMKAVHSRAMEDRYFTMVSQDAPV